ncbi:VENN motif pre-toxin domain-containing protein, partial [Bartonella sp. ML70XJBT.G]|uniref:VENN motif pre-toxin domain-containing protein n=1 Tax=Bartonella sp. ML70XJBT.G TaxID=3019093 RepID=UPI00235DFB59
TVTQIIAHAGLGCLVGATANGDCRAGAIGGAVGEATAMLQFKLWSKNFIQKEIAALDGRIPTAEEQARINAKIEAQFADFNDHAIDISRIAGGFAAALAGGDVNTGADAAGNAAENNFLPAVAAFVAFVASLAPEELTALSLFMAGGATLVQSSSNRSAIADFLAYWFASKNSAEDSEKTNQNSKEEKDKNSQKESKNKTKNGNNKEPQNNNDGKSNLLQQVRKHHDKKRDEKKQELKDEGCIVCETEMVFKTKNGNKTIRSRADIVYIKDGKIEIGEVKTGENADLTGNQIILKDAFEGGKAEPTKGGYIKFLKENKEFLEKYQADFKNFKGNQDQLREANQNWIKEQLSNKLEKTNFNLFRYPGLKEIE